MATELLDGDQVAEQLRITPRHLRSLVARGLLPVVKVGHLNRYRPSDVAAFIEGRTVSREQATAAFVDEVRAKRAARGDEQITDPDVYMLLDGLLAKAVNDERP